MEPCNIDDMLPKQQDPDFTLYGLHFGRGDKYETDKFIYTHTTTNLRRWNVVDEALTEIDEKNINQFFDAETYIIQWNFTTETLCKGGGDVEQEENRMYFYWKGENATKGYSPLPDEIEKENPSVERIVQWAEPPAFLQLFSGAFIVHSGKENTLDEPRLYILRGEVEKELHLYEVPLKTKSLRSRTSFVLYHPRKVYIWHGRYANEHSRNAAKNIAGKVFGREFIETEEGLEDGLFLKTLGEDKEQTRIREGKKLNHTPRLFYFNSITGKFLASEVVNSHKDSYVTPFPFLQSHLYTALQPALFLLDDFQEVWIWYGWKTGEEDESVFQSECLAAETTASNYADVRSNKENVTVNVRKAFAGFEPAAFTNLFPTWQEREDVVNLQEKHGFNAKKILNE